MSSSRTRRRWRGRSRRRRVAITMAPRSRTRSVASSSVTRPRVAQRAAQEHGRAGGARVCRHVVHERGHYRPAAPSVLAAGLPPGARVVDGHLHGAVAQGRGDHDLGVAGPVRVLDRVHGRLVRGQHDILASSREAPCAASHAISRRRSSASRFGCACDDGVRASRRPSACGRRRGSRRRRAGRRRGGDDPLAGVGGAREARREPGGQPVDAGVDDLARRSTSPSV